MHCNHHIDDAGTGRAGPANEWAWTGRALQITLINGPSLAGP